MKTFFSLLFILIFSTTAISQKECGTVPRSPVVHHDSLRPIINRVAYSSPYPVHIFVHVFSDDDGDHRAVADTTMFRQINNMKTFYAPQNICFVVVGIDQLRNSALVNMDKDEEESELLQYLVPDCINIFVHTSLSSSEGSLAGTAYDIPNNYLSLDAGAMESATNLSTLAHEMGHCFGLYHTFRYRTDNNNNNVYERVLRSGACSNCNTEGDLLCDTDADWEVSESHVSETCQYTGNNIYDDCDNLLTMETTNLMTYGRKSCRAHFTNGQGNRMRIFLTSVNFLTDCIAGNDLVLSTNQTVSSGYRVYTARNQVSTNVTSLNFSGSSRVSFSAKEITISPGVSFSPGTSGAYVQIRPGSLCQ